VSDPDTLSERDIEILHAALGAAVDGPFFPDWEFPTLMGVTRAESRAVLEAWPAVAPDPVTVDVAVSNAVANLRGYPHRAWDTWASYSDASPEELRSVARRWWRYVKDPGWAIRPIEAGHEPVVPRPPITDLRVYHNIRSRLAFLERHLAEADGAPLNVNQLVLSWRRASDDFGSWDRATPEMMADLLSVRDRLDQFLELASSETEVYLLALVDPIDTAYRAVTEESESFVSLIPGEHPGWWWHRLSIKPGAALREALQVARGADQ